MKDPPLHLRNNKGLWETWQVDYIGPFRKSEGKQYVLVGGEVVSGLTQAEEVARVTGENMVKVLQMWFSHFPDPQSIQSDNGSHFTATMVQDWAKSEGIKWILHTPIIHKQMGLLNGQMVF